MFQKDLSLCCIHAEVKLIRIRQPKWSRNDSVKRSLPHWLKPQAPCEHPVDKHVPIDVCHWLICHLLIPSPLSCVWCVDGKLGRNPLFLGGLIMSERGCYKRGRAAEAAGAKFNHSSGRDDEWWRWDGLPGVLPDCAMTTLKGPGAY